MMKYHLPTILVVIFATAAVWCHPQGSVELEDKPSSPSSLVTSTEKPEELGTTPSSPDTHAESSEKPEQSGEVNSYEYDYGPSGAGDSYNSVHDQFGDVSADDGDDYYELLYNYYYRSPVDTDEYGQFEEGDSLDEYTTDANECTANDEHLKAGDQKNDSQDDNVATTEQEGLSRVKRERLPTFAVRQYNAARADQRLNDIRDTRNRPTGARRRLNFDNVSPPRPRVQPRMQPPNPPRDMNNNRRMDNIMRDRQNQRRP